MFDYLAGFLFGFGGSTKSFKGAVRDAEIKKNVSFWNIFCMLVTLVVNRFKPVEGKFPDTMDYRFLMMCILNTNKAGIARIDDNIRNLNIVSENVASFYGYPINVGLIDYSGKSYGQFIPNTKGNEDYADCAIVYGSNTECPAISRIWWYASRLNELQTQISTAITNLRATVAITCEKEQVKVVQDNWVKATNGMPLIISYDGSNQFGNKPELLCNPQTGDVLKILMETYDKTLSDFCGEFGIDNNQIMNKMSGVSEKELSQNGQKNQIILNQELNTIREYLKKASEMFDTEIDIELNFDESYNEYNNDGKESTEDDGIQEDISGTGR